MHMFCIFNEDLYVKLITSVICELKNNSGGSINVNGGSLYVTGGSI